MARGRKPGAITIYLSDETKAALERMQIAIEKPIGELAALLIERNIEQLEGSEHELRREAAELAMEQARLEYERRKAAAEALYGQSR